MLEGLYHMKGLALGRYGNVNKVPCAELSMENNFDVCCTGLPTNFGVDPSPALPPRLNSPSASPSSPGATTSQRCWEQAQPLAAGLSEDFDDMGDAPPFPPEMASSSEPEPPVDYIRMEYHPHNGRQPRLDTIEEFQAQTGSRSTIALEDKPWSLFSSRDDFELAEWILELGINQGDIDALLTMMIKRGGQFESSMFTVPLQGQPYEFTVYHRDLCNTSQRFYMEPHTGNMFWEIQTTLPDGGKLICYIIYADKTWLSSFGTVQGYPVIVRLGNLPSHIHNGQGVGGGHVIGWLLIVKEEAQHTGKFYYTDFKRAVWHKAFEFILSPIKDKSKFSAWVQVARAAELYLFPTIMILSADYEEQCMMALTRGCNAYFPCNIWMVPFEKQYRANETYKLRTSADAQEIYEEAKKIRGTTARNTGLFADHLLEEIKKRMIKLGSSYTQLADKLLQAFPSWKDLYHFKQGFMNVMFTDGRKYEALSKLIFIAHAIFTAANDPIGLTLHTSDTLRDGRARIPIFASVIEEYEKAAQNEYKAMRRTLTCTDTIPKEKKLKRWNFPKAHSHQHIFDEIKAKGIMLNYNTKPNESMHGSFKQSYQHRTNFKNVDEQILRVDDWYNTMTYIQQQVNHHDKIEKEGDEDDKGETGDSNEDELAPVLSTSSEADYAATTSLHGGHGKGGSKLSMAEVEAKAEDNSDFCDFQNCLSTHMKKYFESHPEELPSDNGVPAEFDGFKCQDQISLYGMIKVNYSSVVDWSLTTDILRCLPSFNYHPHYDFVLLETNQGPMFAQLVLVFECVVHKKVYPLMLVQLFKEAIGPITKKDHDLGFYRVRTRMKGNPLIVSIYSVIWGALLIEDMAMNRTINQGEHTMKDYLVVDMIDADMFLRMQNLSYVGRATRTTRR
ncbi:hypothetical protein EDD18DRAFT_1113170 [Armillaria luteobubalina]|uniref:Uncharacterized protein n=1 Tax=Armillaria luteobubalina TaxID=153913 RepID=A0AA39PCE0_9AGAR|nr:hypothetical protein EDD18DRAFT_1113170 [Armillaria luteobubalina]